MYFWVQSSLNRIERRRAALEELLYVTYKGRPKVTMWNILENSASGRESRSSLLTQQPACLNIQSKGIEWVTLSSCLFVTLDNGSSATEGLTSWNGDWVDKVKVQTGSLFNSIMTLRRARNTVGLLSIARFDISSKAKNSGMLLLLLPC
jgi:hypothetical protein